MSKKKPVPPYLTATNQDPIDLSYFDRLPDVASPEPVQKRKTSIMARMGDAGVSLLKGAIAVPEAVVGVADIATGGRVGKFLENEGGSVGFRPKQAKAILDEQYSDAQKDANAQVQQAEGVVDTTMAALSNPSTIVQAGLESVPSMLTGGVAARGLVRMAPKIPGLVAGAAGEGVVGAGSSAEQIRQETADGLLTPQQAAIAASSGAATGLLGVVGAKVAQRLGIADVDTMLAGVATNPAAQKNVVRRVLEGAVAEGGLEELPQSIQEQVSQNLALGKPLDEGVVHAAVLGTLAGGAMGGLANIPKPGPLTRAATAGAPVAPPQVGPINFENVPIPKPHQEMTLGGQQDGIPFEADQRFKQAPIYPNGRAPERQQYGTQQAADIALGEQGLVGSHRVVEARPGVFEIRPTAAPKVRMVAPGIYETPPQARMSPASPMSPPSQTVPNTPGDTMGTAGDMLGTPGDMESDEPAPITPIQTLTPEQRRAGVDPLTGEVPPPPPFNPIPPAPDAAPDEQGMVKGPDGTARATFETEKEARDYISTGRKADRSIAISHQPVQLPDGRWTLALPGEPGHKGTKIKARMDGAGIPGQDATLLDPNTAKPWRTKQAASKFNKTVDGYEVLQQPDNGWVLQKKVQGAAPEAQPGMSVSQEAPKDAAPTPIEFSAEERSRIEGLFADGRNGAQIAKALGRSEPQADVLRAVGALRKDMGIPGVSDAEAFKAWRESRKTVDTAAHEAAPSPKNGLQEPTEAQQKVGNYRKGHATISGLDLSIENPQGSVRRGKDRDGKEWENTLQHHYGYIKGTVGNDKDHVDAFVKPGTAEDYTGPVFVVDQVHPDTGKFDEHKALIGFATEDEARKAYAANYDKDWQGLKAITSMPFAEFKAWVKDGAKTKPVVSVETPKAAGPQKIELSKVRDVYGTDHWLNKADIESGKTMLRRYSKDGAPIAMEGKKFVHSDNLDPTGEKAKAAWKDLPIFDNGQKGFKSADALKQAIKRHGQDSDRFDFHEESGRHFATLKREHLQSQPETETRQEPSKDEASTSQAEKWNAASQAERFETLKAAGWGFGKAGPSASTKQTAAKTWDKLTDGQRERIGAAMAEDLKSAQPAPESQETRPSNAKKAYEFDRRMGLAIESGEMTAAEAEAAGVPTSVTWDAHRKWAFSQAPKMTLQEFSVALKWRHGWSGPEVEQAYRARNGGSQIEGDSNGGDKPDVAAIAGSPADAGPGPAPDAGAGEPSVGSGTDDTRGAVDSSPSEPLASAAEAAPSGGGGDGTAAIKAAAFKVASGFFGRDIVAIGIQNDWQKLLDAADVDDITKLEGLYSKYERDFKRDGMGSGTAGAGPGKVKQARRGAALLARFALELSNALKLEQKATHKDPGEAPEPATAAVVRESLAKAAGNTARKPADMKAELLAMIDAKLPEATEADDTTTYVGYVSFNVPGDGTFKVLNTKSKLEEFRRKVETSPGFKASTPKPKPSGMAGGETGYGGALGAVKGMIDEGDAQAAVDYAAARGMNLADVLKGDKVRLGKIAGIEPTGEPVVEAPADASWMAMYEPEPPGTENQTAPWAEPAEEKPNPKALTTAEMVQKGRDDFAAGADRQAVAPTIQSWQVQDWMRGWDEAKADADAAGKVVKPSEFPLQEASSSYSGISHSGSDRAKSDRDAFVQTVQRLYDEALPLAETPAQREALDKAIDKFKAEYLSQAQRVIKTRAGTVSSYVAGRSNFNTKQADKRGTALDKALDSFAAWEKEAAPEVKAAVLAARTPEQIAKEQADKAAKQAEKDAKRRASDLAFMEKILNFKAGDTLKIGTMLVTKVSNDQTGYPLTLTIKAEDGSPLTDDKLNLATSIFGSRGVAGMREGKAKIRDLVDAIRENAKPTEQAPEAPAEKPKEAPKPASKTPTVDASMALLKAVRAGTATAEDYKDSFMQMVDNKDAVLAEVNTKTKDDLLRAGGSWFYTRYKGENKAYIVKKLYDDMLDEYALGKTYRQGGFVMMTAAGIAKREAEVAGSLKALVMGQTDEDIKAFAKEIEQAKQENEAERAAKKAAMESPQTLSDFRNVLSARLAEGKTRKEAYLTLTPEQRTRYDELEAELTREAREKRKQAAKTEVRSAGQTTGGEVIATKHTRDGHDLWVVQLADRVSKEDYMTLLASAKKMGGNYSSFRGNGAVPGFQFRSPETAQAFLKLAGGDTGAAEAVVDERRNAFEDDRSQTAVERLREMADKMEGAAEEQLNQERKTNTARRARFAASAMAEADAAKAMARTMRNIAQAIADGKAKFLDAVRTKTQVEMLTKTVRAAKDNELRAKYPSYGDQEKRKGEPPTAETADFSEFPMYTAFRSDLASLARQMLEEDGTKKMGQQLMKVADDMTEAYLEFAKANIQQVSRFSYKVGDEVKTAIFPNREAAEKSIKRSGLVGRAIVLAEKRGVNRVIMSPSEAMTAQVWTGDGDKRITLTTDAGNALVETIGRRGRASKITVPWQFQNTYDRRKALSRIGIETASEFRSALREFIALQERATANKVREMELKLVGKANDGLDFFPTPAEVADQMVEAADIKPDMAVLEPSAGMGHIADRIREAGAEPDVIEMAEDRRELLQEKGYNIQARDFMDMKPREFYTYGDIFRAPDGTEGVMSGSGGMASSRVMLKPLLPDGAIDARRGEWFNRDDLTGIGHRGSDSGYDRIIMNPPFSKRRDAEHVMHAYTLLKPGGRIVAIMGEGVFFGQDKKAEDFRNWLDEVGGTSEKLPEGSFLDPSLPVNTGVNARMVVIDKPEAGEQGAPAFSRGTTLAMPAFDNASGNFNPDLDPYWIKQGKKEITGDRLSDAERNNAVAEYANQWRLDKLLEDRGWRRRGSSNVSSSTYYTKDIGIGEYDAEYKTYDDYETYEIRVSDHSDRYPADDTVAKRFQIGFREESSDWADLDIHPGLSTNDASALIDGLVNEQSAPVSGGVMSRGAGAGMQPEALRATVAMLTKDWSNAPDVVVVSSMNDSAIPAAVRNENDRQLSQGATGQPEGFFYGGKAYLVANQISSEQDARRVLFHETLGHAGLRGTFGEGLKGILGQVVAARPREVRAKVVEYGLSWNSKADRLIAAEEVLAEMAQSTPELGFVRRAVAAIRTWLRNAGLRLGLSDAEIIRDFILPARQFVTGRRAGAGGGVVFSRGTTLTMSNESAPAMQSTEFKEWFGDSVVTKNGKVGGDPLTVYHGTNESFSEFSDGLLGSRTKVQSAKMGFFFTSNPRVAGYYTTGSIATTKLESEISSLVKLTGRRANTSERTPERLKRLNEARYELARLNAMQEPVLLGEHEVTKKMARLSDDLESMGVNIRRDMPNYLLEAEIGKADDDSMTQVRSMVEQYKSLEIEEARAALEAGLGVGGNIAAVNLSIKNPFVYDFGGKPYRDESYASLIAKAIENGNDGVILKNTYDSGFMPDRALDIADIYVAFRPEQIKSAIGNRGTFDTQSPDILFSRSTDRAAEVIKAFDVKQAAKATGNTLAHYRGMAMQALGRRQIVELWGKDLPQLVSYSEHVQRMDAEKNDTAAEADAIADAWGKLKDERELAELMHDATVAQIDPAKGYQMIDGRADYDRLRKSWDALSPEAQAIYIKARDSYGAHYTAVKDSITERIMRTMAAGNSRNALLERMERDFFKSTKGVYFPLARFGKYVVLVRDKEGNTAAVSRGETINEANEAQKRLMEAYPASKGFEVSKILKDKEYTSKDGPGKAFMGDLIELLEGAKASEDLIDSVGQLYLSSLPDLSWAKHGIHRKGTPGFSQDARRAFAQNVFHGARYLARLRWADRLQEDLVNMQEHVQANTETPDFDSIKAQQVVDEMVKRHDVLMNPNSNPVSTALTSIGFVFHLGLSPASAMVNLLQTATTAYPVMGAKWGFDKAAAALMTASREAVKGKNDISTGLAGDELQAYNEAVKTGVIDVTMAHDLAGIATGEDAKVTWAMRPVMKAASFMFHHAEKFNRQVTFMAAYRLARAAGADHLKAYTQAVDATYQGHFDYSSTNRPRFMQGNVAKVVLLFKQYAQNMIYLLARQAHQSLKGLTPEDRAEARKALAGVLVTHASVAGFLGLPLVGTLLSVASWLGSDDDEPWDAEAALRNSLADTFGTQAADIMAKGLSRATPWDISGRVGLNTLILPDMQEGLEGKDLWKATLEAAAGPVAAIGGGILEGLKLFGEGEYQRGAEAMLPAALRGPAKALRYGSEGAHDKTGVSIVDEVSAAGVAGQLLGLSPTDVRLATEAKSKVLSADKALMHRRSTLLSMAAKAAMAQDMEGLAEIKEQIQNWNTKHPSRVINSQNIRASVAARRRRIANSENGVSLPQNRRGVIEAGAFGRQEAE